MKCLPHGIWKACLFFGGFQLNRLRYLNFLESLMWSKTLPLLRHNSLRRRKWADRCRLHHPQPPRVPPPIPLCPRPAGIDASCFSFSFCKCVHWETSSQTTWQLCTEVCFLKTTIDCCQNVVFFPSIACSKLLQEASRKCSHCHEFLPFSSASQDSGSSFLEKTASGRRSFTSTWFPTPAAAPPAAESTQRSSTAYGSSSSLDPSSDTESSSSTAGQLRSPTQRPASSDQGQLETLYEGSSGSPTASLKFNPPYKRRSKNTSNYSSALLFIFGSKGHNFLNVTFRKNREKPLKHLECVSIILARLVVSHNEELFV